MTSVYLKKFYPKNLLKRKTEVLREVTFGTRLPIILTPWKFQGLEFQSVQ